MTSAPKPNLDRVAVVGAGVIGLTTAVTLAEAGRSVEIFTAEASALTSSAAATGLVGPAFAEPMADVLRWSAITTAAFQALADDATEPRSGVARRRGLFAGRGDAGPPPPPIFTELPGYAEATAGELPPGFGSGFWLELPIVDVPTYLAYLERRFDQAGGTIHQKEVDTLAEVAESWPALVNCSGVGAKSLAGDPEVSPIWGMHAIVDFGGDPDADVVDTFFHEGPPGPPRWVGWAPRGRGAMIGGVATPDKWDRDPDQSLAEELFAAAKRVDPRFENATLVDMNAGLRPGRPSIRVEVENVQGSRCVHNYGHGSQGISLSWGCANAVLELLDA